MKQKKSLRRIFRRLWCYKFDIFDEVPIGTPGSRWVGGSDYAEMKTTFLIPFWIIDAYEWLVKNNDGQEWIYY